MTPLTKFWATISQEIEPEISCGLLEKEACQLIEIDKPLFRERPHERQTSMSSSQAADRLYPCKPGYSFPPLLLLSHEKVGLSFVRGVISDVHAAGNDEFNFIPAAAATGTPCGRAFSTSCGRHPSAGLLFAVWTEK